MAELGRLVIGLGPVAIPLDRLITVLAIIVFLVVAARLRARARASARAMAAVILGFIVARLAYVLQHSEAFRQDYWAALAIWQGGFSPWPGVLAASALLALSVRHWRQRWPPLAVLAIVFGVWLGTMAMVRAHDVGPMPHGIVLASTTGETLALDRLRGRPFVINFWASWCGPCRREMPMIVAAARDSQSVPILFVNQGEDAASVAAFLAREQLSPARLLLDPGQRAGKAMTAGMLPTTIFVASDGTIRERHAGEISRAGLAEGIDGLLARR